VRTQAEHRTAIRRLLEWTRGQDIPATLEDFSGKHASAFRDLGLLAASGLHSKTANKIMSSLRSYWAWAISSELVGGENPWTRKSLGVRRASISADERPFTHDELRTLLRGVEDRDLQDFMRIAALTGMRIEEIASLTVAQCRGGLFRVGDAKTESGAGRVIPVHPDLEEVVERRSAGKSEAAFLLMEQSGAGWDGNRSMAISKRFTRARRRLGVDERRVGQRRALINFHSFRRWFIQAAIDQGSPDPWLLADIVGHKAGELPFDLTMRKYPGKSRIDRRRALIEAIRLPD
jgi:integrase